ncbi:hypothetical protein GCM10009555_061560 [Acrocarpospora macrocephala]|uniref:Alcohol dehydrogenase-like C-terminal domain-containing protein n=1 Tax=Acrocarpospora macrocephala TaxID=150177 RepID=A0A5M3WN64_9ACTN|nr:hypothetical protein [Acrocarpospora macrocephala]GES09599.1 hypothetical protein Amac_031950 [Acrocarpospora macrocephala]
MEGTRAIAAVTPERGAPFALTDITLPPLRPDEILVRVRAAGICRLMALTSEGSLALIGTAPAGTTFEADLMQLLIGRKVRGLVEGDAVPQTFLPMLMRQWRRGRFPVEQLVKTYPFDQIQQAADDMNAGRIVKPVLVM